MGRRALTRLHDSSNLELLLDTMCNAFGGVMFVAILLAVLSQFTEISANPRDASAMLHLKRLEARRVELRAVVQRLLQAQRQQDTLVSTLQEDPGGALTTTLRSLLISNTKEAERHSELGKSAEKAKARLNAAVSELTKLRGEIDELREKTRIALRIAKAAREKRTRELRLPKLHPSRNIPYFIAVRWNRLYIMTKDSRAIEYKEVGNSRVFTPIAERGVNLKGRWMTSDEILRIRRDVSPTRYSLQFAVWPDSYAAFVPVRDYFVDAGYDYNWYIVPTDRPNISVGPGRSEDQN